MRSLYESLLEELDVERYKHIPSVDSSVEKAASLGFSVFFLPEADLLEGMVVHYDGTVVGYMEFFHTRKRPGLFGRCLAGFTVQASVAVPGKKLGDVLYDIAAYKYAPLMSDRMQVSALARKTWKRMVSGTYQKVALDDRRDPKTPQPEDDCTFQDAEELNWAITRKAPPPGLDKMMQNHREYMATHKGELPDWRELGSDLFNARYF